MTAQEATIDPFSCSRIPTTEQGARELAVRSASEGLDPEVTGWALDALDAIRKVRVDILQLSVPDLQQLIQFCILVEDNPVVPFEYRWWARVQRRIAQDGVRGGHEPLNAG